MSAETVDGDQVDEILKHLGHIAEVRWLTARIRQLENAAARVVDWAEVWRPPGRLATRIDRLGVELRAAGFAPPARHPSTWTESDWRRRALELHVPFALLLQRACELAAEQRLPKPQSLGDVPAAIADDLVDALQELAARSATAHARKVVQ